MTGQTCVRVAGKALNDRFDWTDAEAAKACIAALHPALPNMPVADLRRAIALLQRVEEIARTKGIGQFVSIDQLLRSIGDEVAS